MKTGIIGGTGLYDLDFITDIKDVKIETSYGPVMVRTGFYEGEEVVFLTRHGHDHTILPHMINHKANISALKLSGVNRIIGTAAVGSMNDFMPPGSFVIVDQFIDTSKGEVQTFFSKDTGVVHLDYTRPYCDNLRAHIIKACGELKLPYESNGCYVRTDGPRFETGAEIRILKMIGADVVGMTNVPEAVLSREAEMCYACVATVTNWAAGLFLRKVDHEEISLMMADISRNMEALLKRSLQLINKDTKPCECAEILKDHKALGKGIIKF